MNRNIYILFSLLLLMATSLSVGKVSAQTYISHSISQAPQLLADAGADQSACAGDSVTLGGTNTGMGGTAPFSYNWNPVVGLNSNTIANPMVGVSANASYLVIVTDDNNCTAQDTVAINAISPAASYSFSPNLLNVVFSDLSTGTSGTSWFWDFGDGNSSTNQNPSYTYSMAGTYTVCLTVDQGTSCEDSTCKSVTVVAVGLLDGVQGSLQIYPNPVSGDLVNFELAGMNLTEDVVIEWFDLQGRRVNHYEGLANATLHRVSRNGLAAGIYEYQLRSGNTLLGNGKLILE